MWLGADVIDKLYKALWLAAASHATSLNQLECIISPKHSYATLNLFLFITSTPEMLAFLFLFLLVGNIGQRSGREY